MLVLRQGVRLIVGLSVDGLQQTSDERRLGVLSKAERATDLSDPRRQRRD